MEITKQHYRIFRKQNKNHPLLLCRHSDCQHFGVFCQSFPDFSLPHCCHLSIYAMTLFFHLILCLWAFFSCYYKVCVTLPLKSYKILEIALPQQRHSNPLTEHVHCCFPPDAVVVVVTIGPQSSQGAPNQPGSKAQLCHLGHRGGTMTGHPLSQSSFTCTMGMVIPVSGGGCKNSVNQPNKVLECAWHTPWPPTGIL